MTEDKKTPTKHEVKEGVVYVELNEGLTRNYVVLGGTRVYVYAKTGDMLTSDQAKARDTPQKAPKEDTK